MDIPGLFLSASYSPKISVWDDDWHWTPESMCWGPRSKGTILWHLLLIFLVFQEFKFLISIQVLIPAFLIHSVIRVIRSGTYHVQTWYKVFRIQVRLFQEFKFIIFILVLIPAFVIHSVVRVIRLGTYHVQTWYEVFRM